MKKLTTILIVTILLAACQPAATPTPEPTPVPTPSTTEVLATTQPQLYGVWYNPQYDTYMELMGPGTFNIYWGLGNLIASGGFSFSDGKMIWENSDYCKDAPASYEITLIVHEEQVTAMRAKLIGDDACTDRKDSTDGMVFKRIKP